MERLKSSFLTLFLALQLPAQVWAEADKHEHLFNCDEGALPQQPFTPPTSKEALTWFKRWAGKQGFAPYNTKDVYALRRILKSGIYSMHEGWASAALVGILHRSPKTFERLQEQYPEVKELASVPTGFKFLQTDDRNRLKKAVLKYLHRKMSIFTLLHGSTFETWKSIRILQPWVQMLDEDERFAISDFIAESMAHRAYQKGRYQGLFLSKLYKFFSHTYLDFFGFEEIPATDFTLIREPGKIRPVILGTRPIDEITTPDEFGIYAKFLPEITIDENTPKNADLVKPTITTWVHDGKAFSANWSIKTMDVDPDKIIPKEEKLPYDKMLKDGKLTGMVVSGSNITEDASFIMDEYLSYYQDQGFAFEKTQLIDDLYGFMKDRISNGEVDYFIKEAHSDGDEKNVVRITKRAKLKVGLKSLKNGTEEKIYLLFPESKSKEYPDTKDTRLVTNEDFGEWVRNRETTGKGPLVYFNSSCWSISKAIYEIESARSSFLIELASLTPMTIYMNDVNLAAYQYLHQFRMLQSNKKIREAMRRDPEYVKGENEQLIFPDEARYRMINQILKVFLNIEITLYDSEGRVYHPDLHD